VVLSALVVNTVLNIALVPVWGAQGAAAAASLSGLVAVVVAFRAFTTHAQVKLSDLRPQRSDITAYVNLAGSLLRRGA
jgi:Na+-driven multidrug efflux pump